MSVAFDSNVNLTVEIGFDSNPFDEPQSYTDVSNYVRSITTKRGRNNEMQSFNAGTFSVVLDNSDNRFNPSQTTYYYDSVNARTKIQPLKRIRLSAEYNSTTYYLFEGFLTDIPVQFPNQGADSTVSFRATDLFQILNSSNLDDVGWKLGRGGFSELGLSTRFNYEDEQELSSERVTRLLNTIGWPNSKRNIDTGTLEVISQSSASNVLTAIKECETAENAQFFIGKNGNTIFRNRDYKLSNTNAINVQGTFSNDGTNLPYTDVKTSFDDNEIINVYDWIRNGGTRQFVSDADSVLRYRPIASNVTTINVSDADVLSIIEQKIAETALPILRIDGLVVTPRENINLWPQVLGREIGDRVSVKIVHPNETSFTDELWIESVSHSINASTQSWSWNVTLSPAGSSAWILGQAKLGEGTRLVYT